MKQEILSLLRERGEYVSGQELCEKFHVSRTAVWKAIESIKKEGYSIDAVRNKGYLLLEQETDVYSGEEILSGLKTKYVGRNLLFFPSIGSTNVEAKHQAEDGAVDGTLVVADNQTAGRGRRGRSWISPPGINTYYTLMLRPEISPDQAPRLTLLMALAVARGLDEICPKGAARPQIKWPNDIVIDGKKVCGILTEMSMEREYIQHVVIGVGINVKQQDFAPEIAETATSLEMAWNCPVKRSSLVAAIMNAFEDLYEKFLAAGDLSGVKEIYESYLVNLGREVRVLDPKGEFTATALGIDANGELLVRKEDGSVEAVFAGEVSVRGVYGYV